MIFVSFILVMKLTRRLRCWTFCYSTGTPFGTPFSS